MKYSVYSIKVDFEPRVDFSVVAVVRMHRNGRICSLFSNAAHLPKLEAGGSNTLSRSIFSMTYLDLLSHETLLNALIAFLTVRN